MEELGHVAVLDTGEVDAQSLNPRHRGSRCTNGLLVACIYPVPVDAVWMFDLHPNPDPHGTYNTVGPDSGGTLESAVFNEAGSSDARYRTLLQAVARAGTRRSRHVVSRSDVINPFTPFSSLFPLSTLSLAAASVIGGKIWTASTSDDHWLHHRFISSSPPYG